MFPFDPNPIQAPAVFSLRNGEVSYSVYTQRENKKERKKEKKKENETSPRHSHDSLLDNSVSGHSWQYDGMNITEISGNAWAAREESIIEP